MTRAIVFAFCLFVHYVHKVSTSTVDGFPDDDLVVTLNTGSKVRGHVLQSGEGNDFQAFENIPYAEPPTGENRFKPPIKKQPWEGIFNATSNTKLCPQYDQSISSLLLGEEDCLVLNVYRPLTADPKKLLPVHVWIHGGGFSFGYGAAYNPKFLIDYDIVIVTINYRLGVLGFLTTLDNNIPGNLGLKDQVLALQWVHDNINAFGGDPSQVTIGGESAGSISVGFLLLSKLAQGLFSAVIQQSGSPVAELLYPSNDREIAFEYGKQLNNNFNSTKSSDLLEMLQEESVPNIMSLQNTFLTDDRLIGFMSVLNFKPVLEDPFNDDSLITQPMHGAFLNGQFNFVPILIGLNSEEAILFLASGNDAPFFEERAKYYDDNPKKIISDTLNIAEEYREGVGRALKSIYTNKSFAEDNLAFLKYSSDELFGRSIARQAEAASRYVPVYMYQLSWNNNTSVYPGVPHTVDLYYLWDYIADARFPFNESLRKPILKWWTNFIKYQNPTPVKDEDLQNVIWPEVKRGSVKYLNIDTTFKIQENPRNYYEIESVLDSYTRDPLICY